MGAQASGVHFQYDVMHSAAMQPQDLHEVKRTWCSSLSQEAKMPECNGLPQGGQQIPVICAGRAILHAGVASCLCGAPDLGNCSKFRLSAHEGHGVALARARKVGTLSLHVPESCVDRAGLLLAAGRMGTMDALKD